MKFRLDDPFCHSLYASKQPATSLLLKVKKRYKKKADITMGSGSTDDKEEEDVVEDIEEEAEYQTKLVGVIDSIYKFKGMCDFQYLPVHRNKETGLTESLVEKVIPSKPEGASFLKQDVPLFMLPPVFSRSDMPSEYQFQPDVVPSIESLSYKVANRLDKNIIGSGRARRPHNTHLVSFEQDEIPSAAQPDAILVVEKGKERDSSIGTLQDSLVQIFAERPVWSRSALKHNCTLTDRQLTVLLPSISYYFLTGPWRATWVRLGYDPRTDPDSLKYQMLDFRVRKSLYVNKLVNKQPCFKQTCYSRSLPTSIQKPEKKISSYIRVPRGPTLWQDIGKPKEKDAYFIFRDGLVPAYNQMFYQLCDIHHEGVQSFIKAKSIQAGQNEPVKYFKQEHLDEMRSLLHEVLKKTLEDEALKAATREDISNAIPGPSTSQAGDADMDDADLDDEDEVDEDSPEEGDDDVGDDDVGEEAEGDNIDEDDESENEMETELMEFLSET